MAKVMTEEGVMTLLDQCYDKCLNGIPLVSPPINKFAEDYLKRDPQPYIAAKKMIDNQVLKCATSGFLTGFGGVLTLPVSIPANVGSVLYVQMRMIACCAYMAGYDLRSDQVQTFVYACLAGVSINEILKKTATKFGEKLTISTIKKIPGQVLKSINKAVGFRFITKFGETGVVNLGKAVPVVGAAVCGGLDYTETRIIGNRAYRVFIESDITAMDSNDDKKIDLKLVGSKIANGSVAVAKGAYAGTKFVAGGAIAGTKVVAKGAKGALTLAGKGVTFIGNELKKK